MAKKIKRSPTSKPPIDPELEEVDEDRAFEIEYDEETNETILVNHYRRQWGDDFDADVEHGWTMEETAHIIGILTNIYILQQKHMMNKAIEKGIELPNKSTPIPVEGNPMQGGKDGA